MRRRVLHNRRAPVLTLTPACIRSTLNKNGRLLELAYAGLGRPQSGSPRSRASWYLNKFALFWRGFTPCTAPEEQKELA
jgi:hypothetical protein